MLKADNPASTFSQAVSAFHFVPAWDEHSLRQKVLTTASQCANYSRAD